ncbi:MAG: hypothetical protein ACR2MF_09435 [Chthoniobacterales bacterium]
MIARTIQHFFLVAALLFCGAVRGSDLHVGDTIPVSVVDVDQNRLSTADGHATVVTVVTREDENKARELGDRVPDEYLGNPKFRMITVVNLRGKSFGPLRTLTAALIRRRLDNEARRLQRIYSTKHLKRDARQDLFAVADFDGQIASRFGVPTSSDAFVALVFNGNGRLIRRWNELPSAEEIAAGLAEAAD